jgi:hypothetical protein
MMSILTPDFQPIDPPPQPPLARYRNRAASAIIAFRRAFVDYAVYAWEFENAERFRVHSELEHAVASMHAEAHLRYGAALPSIIPFHYTQDMIVDSVFGYRKTTHIATVSKRVSVFGRKRADRVGAAA